MRLNSADRSFATVLLVAAVPYLILSIAGCGIVSFAVFQAVTEGPGSLPEGIWPALAALALVGTGTALAIHSAAVQVRHTQTLTARVAARKLPLDARVASAADVLRLRSRMDLVDDMDAYSFTYGLRRPRIAVSRGLVERLSDAELNAVLEHERYHLRAADPLKVLITRALAPGLFFLPVLRHLHVRYLASRELAADRRALRKSGRAPLAGALFKVVQGPAWGELGTAAAIGGADVMDVRVAQLEQGDEPALPSLPRSALLVSVAAAAGLIAAVLWTMISVGGPGELMRGSMMG